MLEIKDVYPELQKMNKSDCVLIHLKNDQKVYIKSEVCVYSINVYICLL